VIQNFAAGGSGWDSTHACSSVFDSFGSVLSNAAQSTHDMAMPTGIANFDALSKHHDFHFA
jgi:hypothetical protein